MYHYNTMDFSEWIVTELQRRGWSRSEAARRGGISPSMFDKVINGYAKPGIRFIEGLAKAFGISTSEIMSRYDKKGDRANLMEQIEIMVRDLPENDQQEILEYARLRRRMAEERGKYEVKRTAKNTGKP
jgi:transcriptional regulator with XRE-family HTH domain